MTPRDLVEEVSSLFSLPDVVVRLNQLIESGDASIGELSELVELDPGLSAAVLKLANSAWYGLSTRVESVSSGVMLIGQKALRDLVLSASVVKAFRGIPSDLFDMRLFWDNSATCGVLARQLARAGGMRDGDRLFTAGLLLGVGKLIFIARRPDEYRLVLALAPQGPAAVFAAETRLFGFDHAALGAELLQAWKLPEVLTFLVGVQNKPLATHAWAREAAIVHVASDIAGNIAPAVQGRRPAAGYAPDYEDALWARLGLGPEAIPDVIAQSLVQTFEILEIINPRALMIF
jgi:HD-like signal output (HDOD) protein